ncbi:MAG: EFR1 family ferrodoxin [Candidatus Bathyarchaeota archaeon]
MKVTKVKLVYFSPTGTSRRVAEAVTEGISVHVEHVDLTRPDAEGKMPRVKKDELAVIAAPVYSGRIPVAAAGRIMNLNGCGGPAVLLAVYGNRAYEDALLELRDIATERGFKPLAAAAFIGEHSYSTEKKPVADGRPDEADLEKARAFGEKVRKKLGSIEDVPDLAVPGNKPYRERSASDPISPETDAGTCILCGMCADVCPTGAVTVTDAVETVKEDCIRCTACVKACPTRARAWAHKGIERAATWLHTNFSERKEPETFL